MKRDIKVIKLKGGRYPSEFTEERVLEEAQQILGYSGNLLSGSKSGYRNRYPEHLVVFNSNIFTKKYGKVWYGDIDITLDEKKLRGLATTLNDEVFVLYEMDGRFENENRKDFEKVAAWRSGGKEEVSK